MTRTAVNVTGDLTAAVFVANSERAAATGTPAAMSAMALDAAASEGSRDAPR
jgi:Na+/H+-dicarboxylate symporter